MRTNEQIRAFVEDHYYCDDVDDNGNRLVWEPFENYPQEWIDEQIDNDIVSLQRFLKES